MSNPFYATATMRITLPRKLSDAELSQVFRRMAQAGKGRSKREISILCGDITVYSENEKEQESR